MFVIALAHLGHLTSIVRFAVTVTLLSGCCRGLGNQSGEQERTAKSVRGPSEAKVRGVSVLEAKGLLYIVKTNVWIETQIGDVILLHKLDT
jgi:hypothetical protein